MRKFGQMWPTLKRLLAYGSPWRKPLSIAVLLLWIAAIAEVTGPLLISYFIDNMVAKNYLPLGLVAGLGVAYVGLQLTARGCTMRSRCCLTGPPWAWSSSFARM